MWEAEGLQGPWQLHQSLHTGAPGYSYLEHGIQTHRQVSSREKPKVSPQTTCLWEVCVGVTCLSVWGTLRQVSVGKGPVSVCVPYAPMGVCTCESVVCRGVGGRGLGVTV